ncbi:MAG TPA: nucleotidyltransferase [Stellaceae bacterium]|nr:nucleotidyltransferase [Stellaceae bacterium]
MHRDFKELLSTLNGEGVRYLIVGGYAVSLHAQPRATKDLDIFIKPDPANADALFRALARFGAPLEGLTPVDFAVPGSFFRMGRPPVMVDILPEIDGVDFDSAWSRRVMETIDVKTGLQAAFIAADDLIAAKLATGRLQDLADVEALRSAAGED